MAERGKCFRSRNFIRLAVGITGAALLIAGIWRGEYAVTLNKAVRICLECIGIG